MPSEFASRWAITRYGVDAVTVRYFDEISQDTGKYCFGVDDTLQCLDMGAVETLIVWENLEVCTGSHGIAPRVFPQRNISG